MWLSPMSAFRSSGARRARSARRSLTSQRRLARRRMVLEVLEDRCLPSFTLGPLVQVAPGDLFAGAKTFNQGGDFFPNTQGEPRVAVGPTNLNHIGGVWQQ